MTIWTQTKIGSLGRVVTGRTPPSSRPELLGDVVPFITPSDMSDDGKFVVPSRKLSAEGAEQLARMIVPANTVCCTCIASIGKVCMTVEDSITNQQVNSIVVDHSRNDPHFVFYVLRTMGDHLRAIASGAATPIINKSAFEEVELRLPELSIQNRVASILSAYDDLIENNTRRIAILDEMARRTYGEWFVNFRAPGCDGLPLVDSPLGLIPQGWQTTPLHELADDIRDGCLPAEIDRSVPYVGLEHIPRRSTTLTDWGAVDAVTSLKLRFQEGDILFGKIRPYFHKVAVAPSDGVASSDTIVVRAKARFLRSIVLAITSSDDFVAHSVQTSNGTKMPRADWKVLRRYTVPLPDTDMLAAFDGIVWPGVELAMNLAKQNRNLRAQRDLLLAKLISGEVDVSGVEELLDAAE